MRASSHILRDAWNSHGRDALFSARISCRLSTRYIQLSSPPPRSLHQPTKASCNFPTTSRNLSRTYQPLINTLRRSTTSPILRSVQLSSSQFTSPRCFSTSPLALQKTVASKDLVIDEDNDKPVRRKDEEQIEEEMEQGFAKSEKADQAAQLDLSARLSNEAAQSKNFDWREIWRLLKIAQPEYKSLAVAVFLLVISSAVSMSIPASIGNVLDIATGKQATGPLGLDLPTFYVALGVFLTVGAMANYGRIIILRIVGERIVTKLRSRLYRNTFIQNAEFFDANRVGDLISRLGSDTIIVGKSITQNLSDGLRSLISGVAGFSLMAYVSIKLTGVLAIMFPPIGIMAFFYGRAVRNLSRQIQKNLGTLTKIAEERLGNVRTSQAFTGEAEEVGRYSRQVRRIFELGKKEAFISASFFSASGWAGNMTMIAILYVGGGMVQSGALSVGELSSFLMYTAYAGGSLFGLSGFYSELMKGVGAASRLFELQDRKPSLSPTIGEPVTSLRGPIRFDNVTFGYPTRPKVPIFTDLSFTIEPGTNIAIVAPSGAGKSTVASLLLRFYSPTSGKILISGKDIATMNARQLRRKIGYVGQEPVLFSGTIAENIAYGRPNAPRSEIVSAARRANCTFIGDFPDGLETHVGARGTQLSGGQKQRIAIARALLKNPDILILDEATSALDAESETLVNEALGTLLKGHNTTISIAHRLSTIKRSDVIICLGSDGAVAEQGSYRQLAGNPDGAFSKLMEWQMSGGEGMPPGSKGDATNAETEKEHSLSKSGNDGEIEGRAEMQQEEEAVQRLPDEQKSQEQVVARLPNGEKNLP